MIVLCLLVVTMPFVRHPFWAGTAGDLTGVKYLGAVCLGYAILALAVRPRPLAVTSSWQSRCFIALALLGMTSSLLWGQTLPVELSPFMNYLSFLGLFFATRILVDSERALRLVVLTAVGTMAYGSLHMIREWQKYGGFAAGYRPGWIFGDSNYFTLSALLVLPLSFYLLGILETWWQRWLCLACLAVMLFAVTLAASRGGFLGLAVAALLVALRADRTVYRLSLTALVLTPLLLLSPSSPLQRFMTPSHGDQESVENRELLWMAGLRMVEAHPVVGIGAGNFKTLVSTDPTWPTGRSWVAHNTYLEVAAELGVPGLLLFLGVIAGSYITARRVARGRASPVIRQVAEALQPALAGFAVASFFVSAQYTKLFWLMVFLSACLPSLADAANEDPDDPPWIAPRAAEAADTRRGGESQQ